MRAKTFSGGYRFKGFKGQAQDKLVSLDVPLRVVIPLSQGFGSSLEPQVTEGDEVYAGQIIGRDDNQTSSPVHSSVNGKVARIEKMNYFNREVPMVIIEGDGREDYQRIEGYSSQWEKLSSQEIEELLYKSGVSSLDEEGIPTHFKTSVIVPQQVEDLIIHGVDSEVYSPSLELFLEGKKLFNFVEGIKILKKIMPSARVHLTLNKGKRGIIEKIRKLASNLDRFEIYPVVPKYPQNHTEILVSTFLNKEIPYGELAADIGVLILSIQTVLQVFEAVTEGKPLIEKIIALCGPSFRENVHVKVRIGTPLKFLLSDRLKDITSRIVLNSLLTGPELVNPLLPLDRTYSQIIAIPENAEREFLTFLRPGLRRDSYSRTFLSSFLTTGNTVEKRVDTNLHGEERPCIQCGYCAEVCPVRIIPTLINRQANLEIDETLIRFGILNCIDCNLCSYVCPSKIPLAANLKNAKARLMT